MDEEWDSSEVNLPDNYESVIKGDRYREDKEAMRKLIRKQLDDSRRGTPQTRRSKFKFNKKGNSRKWVLPSKRV